MSTSTSKRARREEDVRKENNPEESINASSQDILGNGNTEVFSTLIPLMDDVNVLKTCRLVCKFWNGFACVALKKLPWVYCSITECGSSENCQDYLQLLEENKNLKLPSPFRNFKIQSRGFGKPNFLKILKYLGGSPNNYSIELILLSPDVDPGKLQSVFTSNLTLKITKLKIIISDITIIGADSAAFQPDKIRLPHLKTLELACHALKDDKIVILCQNLCQYSPLKSFAIQNVRCGGKLEKVMLSGGIKSVEEFSLKYSIKPFSSPNLKYLCTRIMEIPRLTKLTLCFRPLASHNNYNYECYAGFERIIEQYADTLEFLSVDCPPIIQNKRFPKLREINFECFWKFLNDFSLPVERYPLLKKVAFSVSMEVENLLEFPSVEEQNPGIQDISIFLDCYYSYHHRHELMKFISGAGRVFPHVTSLSIVTEGAINFSQLFLLSVIDKSYLKLTTLHLGLDIDSDESLYVNSPFVLCEDWVEAGWPLEKIPRLGLLHFTDVEKISLGKDFLISDSLFTNIFSRLPNLQHLTFHLNENFSAKDALESLLHLKRITVVITNELEFLEMKSYKECVEEVELLQRMHPGVVELIVRNE